MFENCENITLEIHDDVYEVTEKKKAAFSFHFDSKQPRIFNYYFFRLE